MILMLVIGYVLFRHTVQNIDGFTIISPSDYSTKYGPNIYDELYCSIYDTILLNAEKNECDVEHIIKSTSPNKESSIILDIGSGTGHYVNEFIKNEYENVMGIDSSPNMVQLSLDNYPENTYALGNAMKPNTFLPNTFTHILCMHFTVYYMNNKDIFFSNCARWLKPRGYLVIHLVNRDEFVNDASSTEDKQFDNFTYSNKIQLNKAKNITSVIEKITDDKSGGIRKNKHTLYMDTQNEILGNAKKAGFTVESHIDSCNSGYQYLYVLRKTT